MVLSRTQWTERFFAQGPRTRSNLSPSHTVVLGGSAPGMDMAVALDVLVAGVHFSLSTAPADVGWKSLAVNLSDLAAMGAEPAAAVVSLTWPKPDLEWLDAFSQGMHAMAQVHHVEIAGVTFGQGPLNIAVQAYGRVPRGEALQRAGACLGDRIYVTGTIGDPGLALLMEEGKAGVSDATLQALVRQRLYRPVPRVTQGLALRGIASSAIDVSDGLAADLTHILEASRLGATVELERIPISRALRASLDQETRWRLSLTGGDDYELCFTTSRSREAQLLELAAEWECGCTCIGVVDGDAGLRLRTPDGAIRASVAPGYDHFASGGVGNV